MSNPIDNGKLLNKFLVAVLSALLAGILTFAFTRVDAITRTEASNLIHESETRTSDRVNLIEAAHTNLDTKLDKLSEDVARVNAQVEIILKKVN